MLLLKAYLVIKRCAYQKQLANSFVWRRRSIFAKYGRRL